MINNDIVSIHICEDSAERSVNIAVRLHLYFSGSNKLARSMYFLARHPKRFPSSAVEPKKTWIRTNQSQSILSYEEDYNAADIGGE